MPRTKYLIGNWKMNPNYKEALKLMDEIQSNYRANGDIQMIIAPPAIYLSELSAAISDPERIKLSTQNASGRHNGAYTGEISAEMLSSMGIHYSIVGHSERRKYFNEQNHQIGKKAKALLSYGLIPIICIGEELEDRKSGKHLEVVEKQIKEIAAEFEIDRQHKPIMAYEPVWAIGTGESAATKQIAEMHTHIRSVIEKLWPQQGTGISILYGGSCKPANGEVTFNTPNVDGGLIGGASLKAQDFLTLAQQLIEAKKETV